MRLSALVLIGAVLRLPWLLSRPIWLDEWLTWGVARGTLGADGDLHPGGYALLVRAVTAGVSDPALALRLPAFVASLAAIPVVASAVRRWGGTESGALAAGALAACAPAWVFYGREGRPYSVGLLAILTLLWVLPLARPPSGSRWQRRELHAAIAVSAALVTPWTWSGSLVAACILVAAMAEPRLRAAAGAGLAGLSVGLGLVAPVLLLQLRTMSWPPAAGSVAWTRQWTALPDLFGWWILGGVGGALVGLLVLLGALAVARRLRDPTLLGFALLPLSAFGIAYALELHPLGGVRQCLVLTGPLLVALGTGLDGRTSAAVGGLAALGALVSVSLGPGLPLHDVPAAIAALQPQGEPVWVAPALAPAWEGYGGPSARLGTWSEPDPPSSRPLWVVRLREGAVVTEHLPGG